MKQFFYNRKAFTLVEVVVATGVFAFFLGSVIAALMANAHNGPVNQRRLQAANLAREGIQLVTQIRDTAWIRGGSWIDLNDCGFSISGDLQLEPNPIICKANWHLVANGQSILLDTTTFIRKINISNIGTDKKLVTVIVEWSEGNITMKKIITDWKAI